MKKQESDNIEKQTTNKSISLGKLFYTQKVSDDTKNKR